MIKLLHTPWEDYLPSCKDNQFDLAPVDPPYGLGMSKKKNYGSKITRSKHSKNGSYVSVINRTKFTPKDWDSETPSDEYFDILKLKSKNQIIFCANYFPYISGEDSFIPPSREEFDKFLEEHPTNWILWDKVNSETSFYDCELAWTSFDIPSQKFTYMWNGMMQGKSIFEGHIQQGNKKLNEKRFHPTQKPVNLYKWILLNYAGKGDLILDTHFGSGSLAIACHDMGFDFIGCEKEGEYYNKAKNRLKIEQSKLKLF